MIRKILSLLEMYRNGNRDKSLFTLVCPTPRPGRHLTKGSSKSALGQHLPKSDASATSAIASAPEVLGECRYSLHDTLMGNDCSDTGPQACLLLGRP